MTARPPGAEGFLRPFSCCISETKVYNWNQVSRKYPVSFAFSQELRSARLRAGLTVRQLAERSGLTSATVSRLELGQIASPKPAHLQRLASALGVEVEGFYAAAGILTGGGLPALQPYLRAKYGLGADAAHRVEGYLRSLQ